MRNFRATQKGLHAQFKFVCTKLFRDDPRSRDLYRLPRPTEASCNLCGCQLVVKIQLCSSAGEGKRVKRLNSPTAFRCVIFSPFNQPWKHHNWSFFFCLFQLRISIVADSRRGSSYGVRLFAREICNRIGWRCRVIIMRRLQLTFNYASINLHCPIVIITFAFRQSERVGPLRLEASIKMSRPGSHQLHGLRRHRVGDIQDQVHQLEERRSRTGSWGFPALPQVRTRKFARRWNFRNNFLNVGWKIVFHWNFLSVMFTVSHSSRLLIVVKASPALFTSRRKSEGEVFAASIKLRKSRWWHAEKQREDAKPLNLG